MPQSFFKQWPLKETFDSFLKETFDSLLKETFAHLLSGLQRGRMCFFSYLETLMKLSERNFLMKLFGHHLKKVS